MSFSIVSPCSLRHHILLLLLCQVGILASKCITINKWCGILAFTNMIETFSQVSQKEAFQVNKYRNQFPALRVPNPPIFLDAVGGTQVPDRVVTAITDQLIKHNGNKGGVFKTSIETDAMMDETRATAARFINADDPNEIVFMPSFTQGAFAMSRALAQTWNEGDEIVVTRLDHDANVSPWLMAAEDAKVKVKFADIALPNGQIDMDAYKKLLTEKTKLVAFCAASSSIGTVTPVAEMTKAAHEVGALSYVDAVAYAPHLPIDVKKWGADFVGFSLYKFFGPHVSVLWGKRDLLENIPAYKIRPAPDTLPLKWLNGAQPYEIIAGAKEAMLYVMDVGMDKIQPYEEGLTWYAIDQIKKRPEWRLWGVSNEEDKSQRVPTIAISQEGLTSNEAAKYLGDNGIYIWSRSVYSKSLSERLGLENTGGFLRIGLVHYNTRQEIDHFFEVLDSYKSK